MWQKDLQVIGDMAKLLDCPKPLFTACVPIYTAAMARGFGKEDTASVAEVLGAMAGLARAPTKKRGRYAWRLMDYPLVPAFSARHGLSSLSECSRLRFAAQGKSMTSLELKLELPDRLAREAMAAGLLTPKALRELLTDAMQRRAVKAMLTGAARATASGSRPFSMKQIQAEVNAVRRERRVKARSGA